MCYSHELESLKGKGKGSQAKEEGLVSKLADLLLMSLPYVLLAALAQPAASALLSRLVGGRRRDISDWYQDQPGGGRAKEVVRGLVLGRMA